MAAGLSTHPRATVVVPAYNAQGTLGRCLQALRTQTLPATAYEVIVVDDGSTDRTAQVARDHGALVVSSARGGPAAARNRGAAQARGEILLFIDADCQATPGWLEEMLRPLADPGVAAVYGAYRTRQRQPVARFAQAEFDERYARLARRQSIDFLATHAAAFRRAAFAGQGGFRTDLWGNEDVELAYRLAQAGARLVFAAEAVVYHEHPATLGRYLRLKASRGYWRTRVYASYPGKAVSDSYTPGWLKLQVAGLVALPLVAVAAAVRPALLPLLALHLAGLLATTLPFARFLRCTQPDLALASLPVSLLRSAALALGVVVGLAVVAAHRLRALGRRR